MKIVKHGSMYEYAPKWYMEIDRNYAQKGSTYLPFILAIPYLIFKRIRQLCIYILYYDHIVDENKRLREENLLLERKMLKWYDEYMHQTKIAVDYVLEKKEKEEAKKSNGTV